MRFRKSIKIAPGVRMNISKSGISYTIGQRGASVNYKPGRRTRTTVGLPGTGLSWTASASKPDDEPPPAWLRESSYSPLERILFYSAKLAVAGLIVLILAVLLVVAVFAVIHR